MGARPSPVWVFHADPTAPAPPRPTSPPPSTRVFEDPSLVQVRRLLCELRPKGAGPGTEPVVTVRPTPVRVVVQTSGGGGSAWPSGLFTGAATERPDPLADVAARLCDLERAAEGLLEPWSVLALLDRLPVEHTLPQDLAAVRAWVSPALTRVRAVATLRWLRDHGVLGQDVGPLYRAVGLALTPAAARGAWGGARAALAHGAVEAGRVRVDEAAAAWWGEDTTVSAGGRE